MMEKGYVEAAQRILEIRQKMVVGCVTEMQGGMEEFWPVMLAQVKTEAKMFMRFLLIAGSLGIGGLLLGVFIMVGEPGGVVIIISAFISLIVALMGLIEGYEQACALKNPEYYAMQKLFKIAGGRL